MILNVLSILKYYVCLLVIFLSSSLTYSQFPGGVATNLELWFKANEGVIDNPVSQWDDLANGNNALQANGAARPALLNNHINFNPALSFNGSSDYLPISNLNYSGQNALNGISTFIVYKTNFNGGGYNNNWAFLDYDRSEFFNFYIQGAGQLGFSYTTTPGQSIVDVSAATTTNNDIPYIGAAIYNGNAINDTQILLNARQDYSDDRRATGVFIGDTNESPRFGFIGDGSEANTFNGNRNNIYYSGEIAEVVYYETGSFNTTELLQIQSYLALKYGITLDQSTATPYLASDGSKFWDETLNTSYKNNIAGIVRDDTSGLQQRISQSVNNNVIVTMAIENDFTSPNSSRSTNITTDKTALIWANNNAAANFSPTNLPDINSNINSVMRRIWHTQEIGNIADGSGNLFLAFDLSSIDFDGSIPAQNKMYLIAHTTDDFSGATTIFNSGIINGNRLEFSIAENVLENNTFFTLGIEKDIASPAPGGIGLGLELWYKANLGVTGTAQISQWNDQSGNTNHAIQNNANNRPSLIDAQRNFNPVVNFNGTSHYFSISNLSYPTAPDVITMFGVANTSKTSEGIILSYDRSEYFRFATTHNPPNTAGNFGLSTNNANNTIDDFISSIGTNITNGITNILGGSFNPFITGDNKFLYLNGNTNNSTNAGTTAFGNNTTRFGFIGVGSESPTFDGTTGPNAFFQGELPELIYYHSEISDTDRQQVESYLAIKYGITLDQTVTANGYNYVSSGTTRGTPTAVTFWDASNANLGVNGNYHNDIFGIGRDDGSNLEQSISKSSNNDGLLNLSISNDFISTNVGRNEVTTDKNFLMIANNNGTLSWQTSELCNCKDHFRLNREWQVQLTGNAITQVFISLNEADPNFPAIASNAELFILVDKAGDNGDFSQSPYQHYAMTLDTNGFYSTQIPISASGLSDGDFFTIAYVKKTNRLPNGLRFLFGKFAGTK